MLVHVSQLRDFLQDSLYHPSHGYFSSQDVPVGTTTSPLPFRCAAHLWAVVGLLALLLRSKEFNFCLESNDIFFYTVAVPTVTVVASLCMTTNQEGQDVQNHAYGNSYIRCMLCLKLAHGLRLFACLFMSDLERFSSWQHIAKC